VLHHLISNQLKFHTGGNVMTVFSAPDYPQFQTSDERYNNLGAVLRLREPDYATPEPLQFAAQLPRPPVCCLPFLGAGHRVPAICAA